MDLARARYRVSQFAHYVRPGSAVAADHALRALLSPAEWRLVARLAAGDRRHLLTTHQRLVVLGCADADLLKAALLHDIGKADARARVRLLDRVAVVLLRRWAPGLLRQLARPGSGSRHRFYLALEHPRLGAALAAEAGCPARVCWLIAQHDAHDHATDPALAWLRAVDEEL